jgi:hypothetical protein
MTDRAPVELTNLDRYGVPPLPWSRPRDLASNPASTVSVRLQGIDFRFHTAFGVATAEPYGATRWRFDR